MQPESHFVDSQTGMRYSSFVERISGEGARAWEIHDRARKMKDAGRDIIFLSIGDPDFDTPPPAPSIAGPVCATHPSSSASRERGRAPGRYTTAPAK